MKKLSKVLSAISSLTIAACTISMTSASAFARWVETSELMVNPYPEIYTEWKVDSKSITYRSFEGSYHYVAYTDLHYNWLTCVVEVDSDWKSIYEKYADALDFDVAKDIYVEESIIEKAHIVLNMYDVLDDDDTPREAKSIEDKDEIIKQFCAALQEAGILIKANYRAFYASFEDGISNSSFSVENFTGDIEEVKNIVNKYDESAEVRFAKDLNILNVFTRLDLPYTDFEALMTEIGEFCEADVENYAYVNDTVSNPISTDSIDILAAIGESDGTVTYGDLNADGSVGIRDAILMNKAVVGAITLNEVQTKAADVNGDGTVNGDDLNILLNFLVNNINTLPADK